MVVRGHSFLPLVSFPIRPGLTTVLELIAATTDFFSLYVSLQLCTHCRNASVQPMRLIAVKRLHLSYASLSVLVQDVTGIACNTHLSELAVSQLEVHTFQYIQYHVKFFDTLIWLSRWSMATLECLIYSPFSGEYMLDLKLFRVSLPFSVSSKSFL